MILGGQVAVLHGASPGYPQALLPGLGSQASPPQAIDPLQQTVATIVQQFLNHPQVDRKRAMAEIAFLNGPMHNGHVAELRKIYRLYQQTQSITELITGIEAMRAAFGAEARAASDRLPTTVSKLRREDRRLICFDVC